MSSETKPTKRIYPRRKASAPGDLSDTIAALQSLMDLALQRAEETHSFEALVDFMEKYSRSSVRLASLLKSQRALAEEKGLGAALVQAANEVLASLSEKSSQ